MQAIGIDIGGTQIKAVLITEDGTVLHRMQLETQAQDDRQWKNKVADAAKQLYQIAGTGLTPLGISAPGLASDNNESIRLMPGRLQGLENFVWSDFLQMPAWVLNDAHAALLAEARFGSGKGYQNIVMLTLGTGVGGGIMINGTLHQGTLNRAGHLGHITLNADSNHFDITHIPASLEDAIGDCSVERRSHGRFSSTMDLLQAYQESDTIATYTWLHSVKQLAISLAGFINIISPELIILGGGIAQAGDHLFKPLAHFMDIFEWRHSNLQIPVVPSTLHEFSGAVGAAAFALQKTTSP